MPVVKALDKSESRREESSELVKKFLSGDLVGSSADPDAAPAPVDGSAAATMTTGGPVVNPTASANSNNKNDGSEDLSNIQERLVGEARKQIEEQQQQHQQQPGGHAPLMPEPTSVYATPPVDQSQQQQQQYISPIQKSLGAFAAVGDTESSVLPINMAVEHERARKAASEALARAVELAEQKKKNYNPKAAAEAVHRRDMDFYERYEKLHQHHEEVEQIKRDIQQSRFGSCNDQIQKLLKGGGAADDESYVPLGDEETYESVQKLLNHLVIHRSKRDDGGDENKGGETEVEKLKRKNLKQHDLLDELRRKNRELSAALRIAAMESKSAQELLADRNEEIHRLRGTIGTLQLQVKNLKSRDELRQSIKSGSASGIGGGGGGGGSTPSLLREMDQLRSDYQHLSEQNLLLEKEVRYLRQGGPRRGGGSMGAASSSTAHRNSSPLMGSSPPHSPSGISYQSAALTRAKKVSIRERYEAQERQMMSWFDADANRLEVLSRRMGGHQQQQQSRVGGGLAESVVVKVNELPISNVQKAGVSFVNKPQDRPPAESKPETPAKSSDGSRSPGGPSSVAGSLSNMSASNLFSQQQKLNQQQQQQQQPKLFKSGRAWNAMRQRLVRVVAISRADILRREEIHLQKMRSRVASLSQDLAGITAERDLLLEKVELLLNSDSAGGIDDSSLANNRSISIARYNKSIRVQPGHSLHHHDGAEISVGGDFSGVQSSNSNNNSSMYDAQAEMDMDRLRKELYELKHIMKLRGQDGDVPLPDTDKPIDALFDVLHGKIKHLEMSVQQRDATIAALNQRVSESDATGKNNSGKMMMLPDGADPARIALLQESMKLKSLEKELLQREAEIVALDKDVRERERRLKAVEYQLAEQRAIHQLGMTERSAKRVVGNMMRWKERAQGGVELGRHEAKLRERDGVGKSTTAAEAVADEEQELLSQLLNLIEDPGQQRIVQDLLARHGKSQQPQEETEQVEENETSFAAEVPEEADAEEAAIPEQGDEEEEELETGWSLTEAVENSNETAQSATRRAPRAAGGLGGAAAGRLRDIPKEDTADRRWFVMRRTFLRLITVREEAWRSAKAGPPRESAAGRVKELYSSLMQLEQRERAANRPAFCVDAALETVNFSTATLLVDAQSKIEDVEREYVALRQLLETRATHERQLQSERDQAMAELHRITRASSEQEQAAVAKTITEHGALSIVHRVSAGQTAAAVGAGYGVTDYGSLAKIAQSASPPEEYVVSAANGPVWLPILNFGVLQSLGDEFYSARSEELPADSSSTVLVLRHHVQPNESLHAIASRVGAIDAHVLEACTLRPLVPRGDEMPSEQEKQQQEVPVVDIVLTRKAAFSLLQQHYKNQRAGKVSASGSSNTNETLATANNENSSANGSIVVGGAGGGPQQQGDRIFARMILPPNAHTSTTLFARQYNVEPAWLALLNQPLITGATVRLPFHFTATYISLLPELTRRGALEVHHAPGARQATTVKQVAELYGATEEEVRERVQEFEAMVGPGASPKKKKKQQHHNQHKGHGGDDAEDGSGGSGRSSPTEQQQQQQQRIPGVHDGALIGADGVEEAGESARRKAREEQWQTAPLFIPLRNMNAILDFAGEPQTRQTVSEVITMARAEEVWKKRRLSSFRMEKAAKELLQSPPNSGDSSSSPTRAAASAAAHTNVAMRLIDRASVEVPAAEAAGVNLVEAVELAPEASSIASLVTVSDRHAAILPGVPSLYDDEQLTRPSSPASAGGGDDGDDEEQQQQQQQKRSDPSQRGRSYILRVKRSALVPSPSRAAAAGGGSPHPHQQQQQQQATLLDAATRMGKLREDIDVPNADLLAEKLSKFGQGEQVDIDVEVAVQLDTETAMDVAINRLNAASGDGTEQQQQQPHLFASSLQPQQPRQVPTSTMHAVVPLDGSKSLKELARQWMVTLEDLKAANPELKLDSAAAAAGGGGEGGGGGKNSSKSGAFMPSGRIRVPIRSEADVHRLRHQTGEFYAVEKIKVEKQSIADPHLLDKVAATYGVDAKSRVHVFDAPLTAATPYLHVRAEARKVASITGQVSFCLPLPALLARMLCGLSAEDSLRVRRAVESDVAAALADCAAARKHDEPSPVAVTSTAAGTNDDADDDANNKKEQQTSKSAPLRPVTTGVDRIQAREVRDRNDWVEVTVTARSKRAAFALRKYINENWLSGQRGAEAPMPQTDKLLHVESVAVADVKPEDVAMLKLNGTTVRELKVRSVDLGPALRIVRKGDSLRSLAIAHGVGVDSLISANPEAVQMLLTSSFEHDRRPLGSDKLIIPRGDGLSGGGGGQTLQSVKSVQVKAGENLVDVVTKENCLLRQLKKINLPVLPLFGPVHLIRIPQAESTAGWRDPAAHGESTTVRCTTDGDSLVAVALRFGADVDDLYFPNSDESSSSSNVAAEGEDLFLPKKSGVRIPPLAGGLTGVEDDADQVPYTVRCTDIVTDETDTLRSLSRQWAVSAREIALYNSSVVRVRKGAFITIITKSKTTGGSSSSTSAGAADLMAENPQQSTAAPGSTSVSRPDVDFSKLTLPTNTIVHVMPTIPTAIAAAAPSSSHRRNADSDDAGDDAQHQQQTAQQQQQERVPTTLKYMRVSATTGELILNYHVKPTDTLASIADHYAQPVTALLEHNPEMAEHPSALAVLCPVAQEHINDVLVSQPPHLFALVPHKEGETLQITCKKYSVPFSRANDATLMLPEATRQKAHLLPVASATCAALCRQMGHPLYFALQPNRGETLTKMAERCLGSARDVDRMIAIGKPLGSLGLHAVQVPLSNAVGKALMASGEALLVVQEDASSAPQVLKALPEVSETLRVTQTAFIEARERALSNRKATLEGRAKELDRLLSQVSSRIDATEREYGAVSRLRGDLRAKMEEEESRLAASQSMAEGGDGQGGSPGKVTRRFMLFGGFGRGAGKGDSGGSPLVSQSLGNNASVQTDTIAIDLEHFRRNGSGSGGGKLQYVFSPKIHDSAGGLRLAGVSFNNTASQTVGIAVYQSTSVAEEHARQTKRLQELEAETDSLQQQLDAALEDLRCSRKPGGGKSSSSSSSSSSPAGGIVESLHLELESQERALKSLKEENASLHSALADAFEGSVSSSAFGGGDDEEHQKRHPAKARAAVRRGMILTKARAARVKRDCTELKALVIRLFGGTVDHLQDAAATAGMELSSVDFSALAHLTQDTKKNRPRFEFEIRPAERRAVEALVNSEQDVVAPLGRTRSMPCMRSVLQDPALLEGPAHRIQRSEDWAARQVHDYVVGKLAGSVATSNHVSGATGLGAGSGSLSPAQRYGQPSVKPTMQTGGGGEVLAGSGLRANVRPSPARVTIDDAALNSKISSDLDYLEKNLAASSSSAGSKKKPELTDEQLDELELEKLREEDKRLHPSKSDIYRTPQRRLYEQVRDSVGGGSSSGGGGAGGSAATGQNQPRQLEQDKTPKERLQRFVPMLQVIQALQRSTAGQIPTSSETGETNAALAPTDRDSIERARAADEALHHETMGIAWKQLSTRLQIKKAKLRMEELSLPATDRRAMSQLVGMWKHWLARWSTRRRHILYQRRSNIETLVTRLIQGSNNALMSETHHHHHSGDDDYEDSFSRRVMSPHRPTTSNIAYTSALPPWLSGGKSPLPVASSGRTAGGPMFHVGGGRISPSATTRSPLPASTARGGPPLLRPMLPPPPSSNSPEWLRQQQQQLGAQVLQSGATPARAISPVPPSGQKSSKHFARVVLPNDPQSPQASS